MTTSKDKKIRTHLPLCANPIRQLNVFLEEKDKKLRSISTLRSEFMLHADTYLITNWNEAVSCRDSNDNAIKLAQQPF